MTGLSVRVDRGFAGVLLLLSLLATLPYVRAVGLPLISDDYLVIGLSKDYGPVSGWLDLLADPLYRSRTTTMVLAWWIYEWSGMDPLPYNLFALLLHGLNTWLVFAFGRLRYVGWRVAALMAAFFAVYEGHQEAVIWFSAVPELLVFFFGLLALHTWVEWLEGRRWCYGAAMLSFVLALLSKESGVVFAPLLLLPLWLQCRDDLWRRARGVLPFFAITAVYVALVFSGKSGNHHFDDGTFSLRAPFWLTIPHSIGRMLWIWGIPSMAALLYWRPRGWKIVMAVGFGWMTLTLLPYSFLTYMTRVPSRHTYLASAGLSLLVGYACCQLMARYWESRRWVPVALGVALVSHNCLYVWLYKHDQYVRRAAPTEHLIRVAEAASGPIFMESFPYTRSVAEHTVELMTGKPRSWLLFDPREQGRAVRLFSWKE
ncbi:MAG: hypothetical protein JNL98_00700 [Bryobacterales bacterium]|nr:hypothetical protein [Bryobacterales bacterium]